MLKAIHCNPREHNFQRVTSLEQVREIKKDPSAIFWLDVENPSEQDLAKIGEEFQLHPLAIEDASHEHQRPKVEEYEQFYFVVFYTINRNQETKLLDIHEVDMFLGKNYLITVHEKPIPELNEVEHRWTRNVKQLESASGAMLVQNRRSGSRSRWRLRKRCSMPRPHLLTGGA